MTRLEAARAVSIEAAVLAVLGPDVVMGHHAGQAPVAVASTFSARAHITSVRLSYRQVYAALLRLERKGLAARWGEPRRRMWWHRTAVGEALPSGPESVLEVPPSTACKHGRLSCEVCGTSDRRDAVHTTQGGAGKVARLRRKPKP